MPRPGVDGARDPACGGAVVALSELMPSCGGWLDIVARGHLPERTTAEQTMHMPAQRTPPRRWTEAEFYQARDAAPFGERWELLDGEVLVTPSPHWTHQGVAVQLAFRLNAYVQQHALGKVFTSPLDVKLELGLVLQPDILIVPAGELEKWSDTVRRLLLAVEVLSPSSARFDRVTKRPGYQRNRVPEYWIVDAESRTVERWRPDDARPELISERLEWRPEGAREPLSLALPEFFAEVLPRE